MHSVYLGVVYNSYKFKKIPIMENKIKNIAYTVSTSKKSWKLTKVINDYSCISVTCIHFLGKRGATLSTAGTPEHVFINQKIYTPGGNLLDDTSGR